MQVVESSTTHLRIYSPSPRLPAMSGSETEWLEPDHQAHMRAFIVCSTLLMDNPDRELRSSPGTSLGEYEILVRLSEAPGRTLRMAQIAESMQHSRSRVTHTVSRMEKGGLIRREAAVGDKRGVAAVMADKGWGVL